MLAWMMRWDTSTMTRRTHTNRRGRPRGSRNEATIVREVAAMRTTITEGSDTRSVSIAEALVLLLERKVMGGDIPADKHLAKLRNAIAPEPPGDAGVLLAPEVLSEEEWIRQQEVINRFSEAPDMPAGSLEAGFGTTVPRVTRSVSGAGGSSARPPTDPPRPSMRNRLIR